MKIIKFFKETPNKSYYKEEKQIILEYLNSLMNTSYSIENYDYAIIKYIYTMYSFAIQKLITDFLLSYRFKSVFLYSIDNNSKKELIIKNQIIEKNDLPILENTKFDLVNYDYEIKDNVISFKIFLKSFRIIITIDDDNSSIKYGYTKEISLIYSICISELNLSNFKSILIEQVNKICSFIYEKFLLDFYKNIFVEMDNKDIIVPDTWPFSKLEYENYLEWIKSRGENNENK